MPDKASSLRFELGDGTWAIVTHSYPRPWWEYRVFGKGGNFIRRSQQFASRAEAALGMEQLRAETLQCDAGLDSQGDGEKPLTPASIAAAGVAALSVLIGSQGRRASVVDVRNGILAAAELLRAAAHTDNDERREDVANWIEAMFAGLTDERALRDAAVSALELYRGGMGGFADYGTAVMAEAGDNLYSALVRGRDYPSSR